MNKFKCTCKRSWFSSESLEDEQKYHSQEWVDVNNHKVSLVKSLSSGDYAELWSDDLENANRHSLTEMPNDILFILKKIIKDEKILKKVMKSLYTKKVGI